MLYFENVTLLTYQHSPVFLEAGLRFKVQKTFTITGVLRDYSASEGVGPIWTKAQILQAAADDNQEIVLNGISFGKGKITTINFEEGNHVNTMRYTYTIVVSEEGNLFNGASGPYAGIDWSDATFIDRLDENFTFNYGETRDSSYDHSIAIKFNRNPEALGIDPIQMAKDFAASLMGATNLAGFLGTYSGATAQKTYTETYNKIDYSCTFVERVDIPSDASGVYSVARSYSMTMNEKGITTISEKGSIVGIATPIAGSASTGYTTESNASAVYARVSAVYAAYAFSALPLQSVITQKAVAINKFDGTIEYTITFTNDPRVHDLAVWDYTIQVSKNADHYIDVSESGTVRGVGRPRQERYTNALAFYNTTVAPFIQTRITAAYNRFGGTHVGNLTKIKSGFGRAEYAGEISYSQTWTDQNGYVGDTNIRKQEVQVITDYPTQIVYTVKVVNFKEVIQPQNQSSVGVRRINIRLKGKRTTTVDQFLTYAKSIITTNSYNIIGEDTYIQSVQWRLAPDRGDFSLDVSLAFHGFYKAFGDLNLT